MASAAADVDLARDTFAILAVVNAVGNAAFDSVNSLVIHENRPFM